MLLLAPLHLDAAKLAVNLSLETASKYMLFLADIVISNSNILGYNIFCHFTEGVDFVYWWSFIGGGSAPALCAAGLFSEYDTFSKTFLSQKFFFFLFNTLHMFNLFQNLKLLPVRCVLPN